MLKKTCLSREISPIYFHLNRLEFTKACQKAWKKT